VLKLRLAQPKKQRSAYSAKLGAEIQRVASCIKTNKIASCKAKQLKTIAWYLRKHT